MPTTSVTSTRSKAPAAAVRCVRPEDLTEHDLAAWRELAAHALEPNPFFEPELLVPAAELDPAVRIGLIESGGDLAGVVPLQSALRWRRIPGPCLSVWRHGDCFLGTPLLSAAAPEAAIGALLDHGRRSGLVAFEWLGTGGPVEAALRTTLRERRIEAVTYEAFDRAALVRRDEPTYLDGMVSKSRRRELRRLRRQLSELIDAPLEVHDRSGDDVAVEGFLRAEAAGWKGREGTAFLRSHATANLFRQICDGFHSAGRLQLIVLSAGDIDVAWKVNLIAGDAVFCFKIAYAPEFGSFSPGVQLELDYVDVFHDTESRWSDSCAAPDNEMINRLWPDRRSLATLLVPTGGIRGAASRQRVRTVMAVRNRIRRPHDQVA
jgi:CelD/BcsL family acetyltransferase involved in cellulose biosynthesis